MCIGLRSLQFHWNLADLFSPKQSVNETLASDFCLWLSTDGLGIHNLFGSLFFEGRHHGLSYTGFQADENSQDGSEVIGNLLRFEKSDHSCNQATIQMTKVKFQSPGLNMWLKMMTIFPIMGYCPPLHLIEMEKITGIH